MICIGIRFLFFNLFFSFSPACLFIFFFFNPLLDPPFRFRVTDLFGLFVVALANIELNYGWRICDLRLFNFPFVSSFLLFLSRLFLILFTFFSLFVRFFYFVWFHFSSRLVQLKRVGQKVSRRQRLQQVHPVDLEETY